MAERITNETIEYVGILAQLALSEEGKETARQDMEKMLTYIEKMNELDTEGVEPMVHLFQYEEKDLLEYENVFREDVVTNGDGAADTLLNAPEQKDQGFKVPKTIS